MLPPENANFSASIAVLHDHGVEFIVAGGTAAILLGAPVTTLDLDLVYRRTPDNTVRLMAALDPLGAFEALDQASQEIPIAGRSTRVINLDTLITSKRHANRPKDRLMLPMLMALKEDLGP